MIILDIYKNHKMTIFIIILVRQIDHLKCINKLSYL